MFIIFGNTLITSYLVLCSRLRTLQPPTVSRCGFGGTGVLLVGRESRSAGPQSNNCARGPFFGPRDPEGSATQYYVRRIFLFSCALRTALPLLLTKDL